MQVTNFGAAQPFRSVEPLYKSLNNCYEAAYLINMLLVFKSSSILGVIVKYIIFTVLMFFCTATMAENSEGTYTILAQGVDSCGKFTNAVNEGYNQNNWSKWNGYQYYLSGYLTGVNYHLSDTKNIMGSADMEGIMAFVEKYCRENPLKRYINAIHALETQLYQGRVK